MLDREDVLRVRDALIELVDAGESATVWHALPALSRLEESGLEVDIDLRATEIIGAPVIVARPKNRDEEDFGRQLTKRQKQVAHCLARGLSNKQIARELDISVATTKDHVHAVLDRLGIDSRNRVAALVFGLEQ